MYILPSYQYHSEFHINPRSSYPFGPDLLWWCFPQQRVVFNQLKAWAPYSPFSFQKLGQQTHTNPAKHLFIPIPMHVHHTSTQLLLSLPSLSMMHFHLPWKNRFPFPSLLRDCSSLSILTWIPRATAFRCILLVNLLGCVLHSLAASPWGSRHSHQHPHRGWDTHERRLLRKVHEAGPERQAKSCGRNWMLGTKFDDPVQYNNPRICQYWSLKTIRLFYTVSYVRFYTLLLFSAWVT